MASVLLVFFLIWIILTAFGTFLGYGIFPDTPILMTGVIVCLISWCIALGITTLFSVSKKEITQVQKEAAERSKYNKYPGGIANHHRGIETTNGKLYFFPDSLVFHPHSYKVERDDITIPYTDITDVRIHEENKHYICIESKDGSKAVFSVADKEKWIADIKEKLNPVST
ncbi:MAG: hypothetical protein K6G03_10380 [Lachnospiraceae bacterium]|nr:hypothetical protein [Lachnospiraceae bacterium]